MDRKTDSELWSLCMAVGVEPGDHFRHKKTGKVVVVGTVVIREEDCTPCVTYYHRDAGLALYWVRPASEFLDGRFERVVA